jgi:CRISPR-associated protein Cmr4
MASCQSDDHTMNTAQSNTRNPLPPPGASQSAEATQALGTPPARTTERRLLFLFTRTPLHVGAGASVGAIDQPITRERHTGFPIIPGSAIKGVCADASRNWTIIVDEQKNGKDSAGNSVTYTVKKGQRTQEGQWLFGVASDTGASAGALQFSEAKLLAFPIRSAKGGYAWITCPLLLRRFARESGMPPNADYLPSCEPADGEGLWSGNRLGFRQQNGTDEVVLEEYSFRRARHENVDVPFPSKLESVVKGTLPDDHVLRQVEGRIVVLSDGMLSYFVRASCEVMQRNRIDDVTGTVAEGALFNQENVPVDTLFFATVTASEAHCSGSPQQPTAQTKPARDAMQLLEAHFIQSPVLQIGGDGGIGLGLCTIRLAEASGQQPYDKP